MPIGAVPGTSFQTQCAAEPITTDSSGRASITYGAFPTATDVVFVTIEDSVARSVAVDTLSATGFRLTCDRISATFNLMWYAIGH